MMQMPFNSCLFAMNQSLLISDLIFWYQRIEEVKPGGRQEKLLTTLLSLEMRHHIVRCFL